MQNDEKRIAVFIDFENVAMGVRESKYGNFNIELVLKRLVEKGKIMVKRAYSDWHRYAEFKRAFHQAAIELIDELFDEPFHPWSLPGWFPMEFGTLCIGS